MKTFITGAMAALSILAATAVVHAQSYSIDWHVIAGGGGTSTGAVYSVSGTIGQGAAGQTMAGGNYSVTGGFWSYAAVIQTPGAPFLNLQSTGSKTITLTWPYPSTGFVLQENADLNTTNWSNVATLPSNDGINQTVTVSPPVGNRFYRLFHP